MYSPVGGLFSWRGLGPWREENKRKRAKAPSGGRNEQTSPITRSHYSPKCFSSVKSAKHDKIFSPRFNTIIPYHSIITICSDLLRHATIIIYLMNEINPFRNSLMGRWRMFQSFWLHFFLNQNINDSVL